MNHFQQEAKHMSEISLGREEPLEAEKGLEFSIHISCENYMENYMEDPLLA